MASWREGDKVRNIHLGSSRKIDAEAAHVKARKRRARPWGYAQSITETLFNSFNHFKITMDAVRSEGHVVGSKVSAIELEQIRQLVTSGAYLNISDFVRDAIRDKLIAIKTIKYRDVDYETAKKEIMGYFQERGEAYPSEAEEDLQIDYKLICQIVDELKREGRLAVI